MCTRSKNAQFFCIHSVNFCFGFFFFFIYCDRPINFFLLSFDFIARIQMKHSQLVCTQYAPFFDLSFKFFGMMKFVRWWNSVCSWKEYADLISTLGQFYQQQLILCVKLSQITSQFWFHNFFYHDDKIRFLLGMQVSLKHRMILIWLNLLRFDH